MDGRLLRLAHRLPGGGAQMNAPALVTLPQLAERVGMEYRTAHLWVSEGLIVPSYPSDGTGHPNLFVEADVERAGRLARLREAGLSVDGLRRVVEGASGTLRSALDEWESHV